MRFIAFRWRFIIKLNLNFFLLNLIKTFIYYKKKYFGDNCWLLLFWWFAALRFERCDDNRLESLNFAPAKRTAGDIMLLLPMLETRRTDKMPTRLQSSVLVVLRAYFAYLKWSAHVTIHVILLFGNDYALGCCNCQLSHNVYMHFAAIWIQISIQ